MKAIFVTGNHLRHYYLVKEFAKFFSNFEWIVEKREMNINHKFLLKKSLIYKKHINNFKKKEKEYFFDAENFFKKQKKKITFLDREKIDNKKFNSKIFQRIKKYKPKILFSYGCQKINVEKIKKKIRLFNVHGGIIPKYRGVNTNFWPHKNSESNYVGLTLHDTNSKLDSGDIFFQTAANISKSNETVNSLSCKAVRNFCKEVPPKIYSLITKDFKACGIRYKPNEKIYKRKDFSPSEIKLVYKKFNLFKKKKNIKKPKLLNLF